jgi:hypothetical protein
VTREEFDQVFLAMVGIWPNWHPNGATPKVAEQLLGDLDYDQVEAALAVLAVDQPEFHPGLGALRAKVFELFQTQVLDPEHAWLEVAEARRAVGWVKTPQWSSPLVARAVSAMGGWRPLCASTNPEADRAHFLRIHAARAGAARLADRAPAFARARIEAARTSALEADPVAVGDVLGIFGPR